MPEDFDRLRQSLSAWAAQASPDFFLYAGLAITGVTVLLITVIVILARRRRAPHTAHPSPDQPAALIQRPFEPAAQLPAMAEAAIAEHTLPTAGLVSRVRTGLSKTRTHLAAGLINAIKGSKRLDTALLEDLEMRLLTADVGVEASTAIIKGLTEQLGRDELADPEVVIEALSENMKALLAPQAIPLVIPKDIRPFVILMVGINGAGKTTTIGKLAKRLTSEGLSVMLAAGDTFRAAAVEQLQTWGERNHVPVIAQQTGADSASVIFDALQAAKARGIDVLIADTAGRLHTQDNLMQELAKIRRVMGKLDPQTPHEVMLVVDGGTGQNAIAQARQFKESVNVTGITITKLDGTAKGGVLFAIAKQVGIPIRFIGIGEGIEDLRPFNASEFVDALLDRPSRDS